MNSSTPAPYIRLVNVALMVFCGCLAGFIAASTLYMTYANWLPIPVWDEWGTIAFLRQFFHGDASLGDWIAFHNEHRIVAQRLLTLIDYSFFNGQSVFILSISMLAQCCHTLLLWRMCPKTENAHAWLLKSAVMALLFSFMLKEIFLWAFEAQITLVCMLATGAFYWYFSTEERRGATIAYIGFVFIWIAASLTMANGLFIGLALCITLLCQRRYREAAIISFLFVFFLLLYTYKFSRSTQFPPYSHALKYPADFFRFYLMMLGNPFSQQGKVITALIGFGGSLLLLSGGLRIWKRGVDHPLQYALWAISLFISISLGAAALGRFSWEYGSPYESRYIAICSVFWSAQLLFWVAYMPRLRFVKAVPLILVVFAAWTQWNVLKQEATIAWFPVNSVRAAADCIALGISDPRFNQVIPDKYTLQEISPRAIRGTLNQDTLVRFLKENRFSFFRDPVTHWIGRRLEEVVSISDDAHRAQGSISTGVRLYGPESFYLYGQGLDRMTNRPIKRVVIVNERNVVIGLGSGEYHGAMPTLNGDGHLPWPGWAGFVKGTPKDVRVYLVERQKAYPFSK